jgi:SNF2 family DNA or RNA helicase
MASISIHSSPAKSPVQPLQWSPDAGNRPGSPSSSQPEASSQPAFGKPSKMHSLLYKKQKKKETNIFNPNRGRPELHRPQKVKGPVMPSYQDIPAAPEPKFDVIPQPQASKTTTLYPLNTYNTTSSAFENIEIYTDPEKASADLKALLEGGMEDEDDEKDADGEAENQESQGDESQKNDQPEGGIRDGVIEGIKVKLLPHQVQGVRWMKKRELGPVRKGKVPKGGILADDMGLGKTLQSISLVLSNRKPNHDEPGWQKHYNKVEKGTLVVAPLALIRQWEAEIKEKVTKGHRLNVCVHHGPQRTKRYQDLAKYDVVITTYQILVSEHGHCKDDLQVGCFGLHWYRVILDEAHTIKNHLAKATKACCSIRSEFRWCLTGTPMQNNLDELQSLIHFLRIPPYDDIKTWKQQIDGPLKNGNGHIAIHRLHNLLPCFMKRRRKDILKEEGALVAGGKKALEAAKKAGDSAPPAPAFKVTERKVVSVSVEFSPAEKTFYSRLEERADASLEKMRHGNMNYANALVLLLRLRQACDHPKLTGLMLEQDKDALDTDAASTQKRGGGGDIDALADALGTMGIETKHCDVCMSSLSKEDAQKGRTVCSACIEDQRIFNGETPERKRPKKKSTKNVVKEKVKLEVKKARVPRNRRAIVDSDDEEEEEEEEGSWLVGEDERGSLRLGKAGGSEDENAEGGGDWINPEDSAHESEDEEDSRLSSFIVDDESVRDKEQLLASDDDSLLSLSKVVSQVIEKKAHRATSSPDESSGATDSDDGDSGISESETDSDDTGKFLYKRRRAVPDFHSHLHPSAKIRETLAILHREAATHKFIIFSQFTSMLDQLEPFLRRDGLRFARYDGKMRNDAREASLHALRSDPRTRLLLCSLRCGSLGLNLTAATRVVILEPFWNPFIEEQAIDRVHRLTQTVDVTVYKLTVKESVEERIVELQEKKRLLAEQAIEGGLTKKNQNLKLGMKELMDLFKFGGHGHGGTAGGRFNDGAGVVGQDIDAMVRGPARGRAMLGGGSAVQSSGNPIYGRRW